MRDSIDWALTLPAIEQAQDSNYMEAQEVSPLSLSHVEVALSSVTPAVNCDDVELGRKWAKEFATTYNVKTLTSEVPKKKTYWIETKCGKFVVYSFFCLGICTAIFLFYQIIKSTGLIGALFGE